MIKYITPIIVSLIFLIPLLFVDMAFAASDVVVPSLFHPDPTLIAYGLILIVLEFALPTKGMLGIAGIALFVAGTSSLATYPDDTYRLSWPMIILLDALVMGFAALTAFLTYKGYTAKNPDATEILINKEAKVIQWNDKAQTVEVGGSIWKAVTKDFTIPKRGDKVVVVAQENLTLTVILQGEIE